MQLVPTLISSHVFLPQDFDSKIFFCLIFPACASYFLQEKAAFFSPFHANCILQSMVPSKYVPGHPETFRNGHAGLNVAKHIFPGGIRQERVSRDGVEGLSLEMIHTAERGRDVRRLASTARTVVIVEVMGDVWSVLAANTCCCIFRDLLAGPTCTWKDVLLIEQDQSSI